ncbi:MAG: hypothetical protein IJY99_03090 [Alphaproteobacteria bacterium]|nr:hypothetical protein [Alphaproteobacteria bacterium]
METGTILRLLKNSGFHGLRVDAQNIYMEDPTCILRAFETFVDYAWVAISVITALLIFGWGISLILGAKYDNMLTNVRNLILIFGTLTIAKPIINFIYGQDLFARGCKIITVSIEDTKKLLDARNEKLKNRGQFDLYENMSIYDSGAKYTDAELAAGESQNNDAIAADIMQKVNPDGGGSTGGGTTATPGGVTSTGSTGFNGSGVMPTSATEEGKNVVYHMPDGSKQRKSDGTRAWRNTNPGNIRYGNFAKRAGAIGKAGGFSVFPDEATGQKAIESLLTTDTYKNLTVAAAISKYAPPVENDTAAYQRNLEKMTGISINKRISDLTPAELSSVAGAIRKVEGWGEGKIERL